ncbi:hypothetical protein JF546_14145 [Nitratireductor aquimarinus]|nr:MULTISPECIES: hypothetical protein [Nitratireductor]MBN7778085.1 hypothetical protein [Nitratireductor pacificus]MBY6022518.1 hypothetical protein [Nitratireductor sp. DP7N14-4]MBN7757727.1 hypothetical protein [Nitratireductor aquimarinus]MBN7762192.1 hypothetical protein [Nitratireductor aquibiodomus]MBN7782407.1 hypothetical protein [Nitratireductor pacificus]
MLMKLDTSWLLFALVAVTMISYILSLGLSAALGDDGFGTLGNATIITLAFFGTIYVFNERGTRFGSLLDAALAGLGGAFGALLLLVIIKAIIKRIG